MKAEPKDRLTLSNELRNLRQNRLYLAIMALLLIGAIIWVLLTIMDAGEKSEVATEAIKYSTPINPNLDVAVFTMVENKRLLTESELESFPINRLIKDRSGNYSVIPYDTPKDKIEELTSGTKTISKPVTVAIPAKSTSATSSGTKTP